MQSICISLHYVQQPLISLWIRERQTVDICSRKFLLNDLRPSAFLLWVCETNSEIKGLLHCDENIKPI